MSLKEKMNWIKNKRSLPLVALAGLVITVLIVKLQPAMEHSSQQKAPTPVNVIEIKSHKVKPTLVGFGTVKPDLILKAMAEIAGRVTYVHPELKKGAFIAKGTLVVSIDDKDYQLAIKQANSDLLAAQASLKEMQLTIDNNELELKLANEKLKVRNAEFGRLKKLRQKGTVSQSRLDQERQSMLVQQQEVQKLENLRTTLPSELEVLKTKIDIAQAKLEQSERDLARTQIYLPFNGRISSVSVEKDQFIAKGNSIFNAVGIDKITINTQFPIDQFGQFVGELDRQSFTFDNLEQLPAMSEILAGLGLTAQVQIAGEHFKGWQAKVERFSDSLDLQSRTVGVIVSVEGSYLQVEPGVRPPLLEGMYMKVMLQGRAESFLALPRFAIQNQQALIVNSQSQLSRVTLDKVLLQDSLALVKEANAQGIAAGDKIVVSDLFPAVNGMTLSPIADAETEQQMNSWLERAK